MSPVGSRCHFQSRSLLGTCSTRRELIMPVYTVSFLPLVLARFHASPIARATSRTPSHSSGFAACERFEEHVD